MAVLRGAAGWIIRQAAAIAGGGRWAALACLSSSVAALAACAGAVRSGKAGRLWALCRWRRWRWCVVIVGGGLLLAWSSGAALAVLILPGAGGGRCDLLRLRCAGVVIWDNGGATPRACRAADSAGRAGGRAWKMGKRKRPGRRRVVRCCSGLLSAVVVVRSAAPGASRCISWAAGSAPRSGAGPLALALIRAQRFQLATFQHGTACAGGAPSGAFLLFAGGVRFSI